MKSLEELRRNMAVTSELHSLVKTMKALAGVNLRQYERAAQAISEYDSTIETGLQVALQYVPEPAPPRHGGRRMGALVFGSDQGMCGPLNERIVAHADRALGKLSRSRSEQTLLAVGLRAADRLKSLGFTVEQVLEVPSSMSAVGQVVHEVLAKIQEWYVQRGIEVIVLFYCQALAVPIFRPRGVRLLPVDLEWVRRLKARPWPSKVIPTFTMDKTQLFHALIREYLFASLFRALAQSLASENASRLAAMEVADRNIEERSGILTAEFRHCREDAITSELLDLVTAFEALTVSANKQRSHVE
jgi:F-type H+-transporting ATPase subunit gamma